MLFSNFIIAGYGVCIFAICTIMYIDQIFTICLIFTKCFIFSLARRNSSVDVLTTLHNPNLPLSSEELKMGRVTRLIKNNLLSILTIAAVIIGVIVGVLIRDSSDQKPEPTDELIKGLK